MLKNYIWNGAQFQFEAGQEPAGAVELAPQAVEPPKKQEAEKPAKAVKPANKAKAVKTK